MSSPLSPRLAEGVAALGDAAVRVAEESLFAYAETCAPRQAAGLIAARPPAEPWLTAAIAFTGPFEGTVSLALPQELCAGLAGAFCGLPADSLEPASVADFAGELANMICGSWLTRTHRTDGFALAAPVVTEAAPHDAVANAGDDAVGLVVHDTPLLLALAAGRPVATP